MYENLLNIIIDILSKLNDLIGFEIIYLILSIYIVFFMSKLVFSKERKNVTLLKNLNEDFKEIDEYSFDEDEFKINKEDYNL